MAAIEDQDSSIDGYSSRKELSSMRPPVLPATPPSSTEADSTKESVEQFIRAHPGAHLRQIKRELNIAMGVIQYHLYALERESRVVSRHRGLYKRFYPALVFGENQQEILDVLSQETERDLLLYIISNPDATQKQLSEYAQISAGTINWHMNRLIETGLVRMKRDGQFARYVVACDKQEVLKLLKGFHPRIWERWADRFANALTEATSVEVNDALMEPGEEEKQQETKRI